MFYPRMKYLDGTPVEKEYEDKVAKLVGEAADIEQQIPIDELEAYADKLKGAENGK